jgi:polysaccharide biosynthesis/export protein
MSSRRYRTVLIATACILCFTLSAGVALPPSLQTRTVALLGPGDGVAVSVYGQPDLTITTNVAEDGTLTMPLIGKVPVGGLSTTEAGTKIEQALVAGKILVNPQVIVSLAVSRSQRVSVLGEVGVPGRYPVETSISIFDLLAQAGGAKDTGATYVYLLRPSPDGKINRYTVNLKGLVDEKNSVPNALVQGGDTIFVPKAPQVFLFGEVAAPNVYRFEPGTTYLEAIVRAGGVTPRGSMNRLEVKRKDASGVERKVKVQLSDMVQPGDVIRVKESIF